MSRVAGSGHRRLFFALWPDAAARAALARLAREVAHDGQGRAPRNENLHVTLAFLGNVARERFPALLEAGQRAAVGVPPFRLSLERVGGGSYAITWLTPATVPEPLRTLHAVLNGALDAEGFATEQRMFRPHLTLARDCVRRSRRGAVPPIEWRVDSLALASSTTAAGGSIYELLAAWPLGESSGAAVAMRHDSSRGAS